MSPRPRLATDTEILMAVFRVVARNGPARMTLADVAKEVGLSAAALVQRFGSKRALLLAAAADAAAGHGFLFAQARAKHASPLSALVGLAECMTVFGNTREEVANSLSFFCGDLADKEFRAHAQTGAQTFQSGLRSLLRDAIAAGEIEKCDAGVLARELYVVIYGALLDWVIEGDGDLAAWLRRHLRAALRSYR